MKMSAWRGGGTGAAVLPGVAVALLALALAVTAAQSGGAGAERIVVLLLVAPLAEEVIFRAGLHEALLRRAAPAHLANVLTALVFGFVHAFMHADAAALLVALPALLIGAVYQRTRRVRHCVLLHAAMNALWLAAGLAGAPLFPAP